MSRELRDLLEQTARGPCDPTFDPAQIAARARRQLRAGAVAAVVVVLATLVGGAAWARWSMDANPQGPFVETSPPDGERLGWQTVPVGSAEVSVPQDWPVIDLRDDPTAYCGMFKGRPSLFLGPAPQPPPPCPNSLEDPVVGVHAVGFAELGGRFDGEPVEVNGHEGIVTDDDGQVRHYVFPELALMLEVSYQPDPQLADQVLSTVRRAQGDDPSPAQPSVQPVAVDPGPALTPGTLPAMGNEGVAVQTPVGVVFVGIDGTVHGHLPGAELGMGFQGRDVPGPIAVYFPRVGEEEQGDSTGSRAWPPGADLWVQPATGSVAPRGRLAAPLQGAVEVVELATRTDPSPLVVRAADGRELARFSGNLQWDVSSGHRVVSWHTCPDGGRDLSSCDGHAYDSVTATRLELQYGCWVSDGHLEDRYVVVCGQDSRWQHGPGGSWIELRDGSELARVEVPDTGQPDATTGRNSYTNAFEVDGDVMATWRTPCEPSVSTPPNTERSIAVVGSPGRDVRPLIGNSFADAPANLVLGIADDGRAVIHVPASPDCGPVGTAGIYLVEPTTGERTPVLTGSGIQAAKMWTPKPNLSN